MTFTVSTLPGSRDEEELDRFDEPHDGVRQGGVDGNVDGAELPPQDLVSGQFAVVHVRDRLLVVNRLLDLVHDLRCDRRHMVRVPRVLGGFRHYLLVVLAVDRRWTTRNDVAASEFLRHMLFLSRGDSVDDPDGVTLRLAHELLGEMSAPQASEPRVRAVPYHDRPTPLIVR